MIERTPVWAGRSKHAYGHLLFINIEDGTYQIDQLQITNPEVIPHGVRCEGLLRVLSWVSFDLPASCKNTLSSLLQAADQGCLSLHTVPIESRHVRDGPIESEAALQSALIEMIPSPGHASADSGHLMQILLSEFLKGFSLRTLIFLLDSTSSPGSVLNCSTQRGQQGTQVVVRYQFEAYAGFHVSSCSQRCPDTIQ